MGRTRARTKTGRSLPQNRSEIKQAAASSSKADSEPSIASLLAKIQQLLTRCEYDLALKFIRRVLDRELANLEALELLGTVNVELGNIEEARTAFSSLVTLTTSQNVPTPPSAHLYLAQLEDEDPKNALRHYETAVELLNALLKSSGESRPSSLDIEDEEIKRMAIKALISMVEIYMSDLCFEDDAEVQCEKYLAMAFQIEEGNLEALQCLASVRVSQQRTEDSRKLVKQVWAGWKAIGESSGDTPPPSTLLTLARLLIELSEHVLAQEVVQVVLQLDEDDVEAWYLRGWCYVLMAQLVKESGAATAGAPEGEEWNWEEIARDARDALEMCHQLYTAQEHPDPDLLEHVKQLTAELEANGIQPSAPDVEEGDVAEGEEDWEDTDDEKEDVEMK